MTTGDMNDSMNRSSGTPFPLRTGNPPSKQLAIHPSSLTGFGLKGAAQMLVEGEDRASTLIWSRLATGRTPALALLRDALPAKLVDARATAIAQGADVVHALNQSAHNRPFLRAEHLRNHGRGSE